MQDQYIINGKRYVLAEEEKKAERLEGWINKEQFTEGCWMTIKRTWQDNTCMVEIKTDEVIVSREDVESAWVEILGAKDKYFNDFMNELGL